MPKTKTETKKTTTNKDKTMSKAKVQPKAESNPKSEPKQEVNVEKAIENHNKVNQGNSKSQQLLNKIAEGFGFALMWKNQGFGYRTPTSLDEHREKFPLIDSVKINPHTVEKAIALALKDGMFLKQEHDGESVEGKIVHEDPVSGVRTIEFLSYSKVSEKKGQREQFDRVVLDSQGDSLESGTTDIAKLFLSLFKKHHENWNGNDIYLNVVRPYLKALKSYQISTSNYFVLNNETNVDLINQLQAYLSPLGYEIMTSTLAKDLNTQRSLSVQFEDILGKRVEAVKEKISGWSSANRVHGRSKDSVMNELAQILIEVQELESTLEIKMTDMRTEVQTAYDEANGIIQAQVPSGLSAGIYTLFVKEVLIDENLRSKEGQHKTYIVDIDDESPLAGKLSELLSGRRFNKATNKVLEHLGFYSYATSGMVIIQDIKALTSSIDI